MRFLYRTVDGSGYVLWFRTDKVCHYCGGRFKNGDDVVSGGSFRYHEECVPLLCSELGSASTLRLEKIEM